MKTAITRITFYLTDRTKKSSLAVQRIDDDLYVIVML